MEPGDIIIVLDQKDSTVFTLRSLDMHMDIQLAEALCSIQKSVSILKTKL